MTVQNLLSRINWRQILLHFLASLFIMYAFQTFAFLYNTKIVEMARHPNNKDFAQTLKENNIDIVDVSYYLLWTDTSGFIGLLVAFLISLIISIRRKWLWINSLLVFLIVFFLYRSRLSGSDFVRRLLNHTETWFNNSVVEFSVEGLVLLTIGLLIFFSKMSNRLIGQVNSRNDRPGVVF